MVDYRLGFAPNRALGAWCARTMSERRLCSFFRARSRARTPCTPHVESVSALPYGASMNASTRCEGGTLIAHNRADERRGRDRIIYLSSRQFFSWLRFTVCGLSFFFFPLGGFTYRIFQRSTSPPATTRSSWQRLPGQGSSRNLRSSGARTAHGTRRGRAPRATRA